MECSSAARHLVAVKFYGNGRVTPSCPGEAQRAKTEAHQSEEGSVANLNSAIQNPKSLKKYLRDSRFANRIKL
jgi:hypothetical protein